MTPQPGDRGAPRLPWRAGRIFPWLERQRKSGPLHFTLLDPDKSPGATAGRVAREAERVGSHAILLGGSTGITPALMGDAARAVHEATSLPVIIFPQGPESITREADALLFMSLMNSSDLKWVIRAQMQSSLGIRALGIEAISLGYLIIEPGMKVGEVGRAEPVPRDDVATACGYAQAAEFLGMKLIYLEAGSGAPAPVPPAMVRAVRETVRSVLVVGGGIRRREDAAALLDAGADVLVTGTVVETDGVSALQDIVAEVRKRRRPPS